MPNLLSDRPGHFTVADIMILSSAVPCVALWLPGRGSILSVAFAVLFGVNPGSVIGLGPVPFATIPPLNELRIMIGLAATSAAVGTLIGPPTGNAIATRTGGDVCLYCALRWCPLRRYCWYIVAGVGQTGGASLRKGFAT